MMDTQENRCTTENARPAGAAQPLPEGGSNAEGRSTLQVPSPRTIRGTTPPPNPLPEGGGNIGGLRPLTPHGGCAPQPRSRTGKLEKVSEQGVWGKAAPLPEMTEPARECRSKPAQALRPPFHNKDEYEQMRLRWSNEAVGNLGYLDCPKCRNKGVIHYYGEDYELFSKECECMAVRMSMRRMEQSGLGGLLERCTFEMYETPQDWQAHAKQRVMAYTAQRSDRWLFVAGQSGCGKTHLCTAVCKTLMEQGDAVKYYLWRDLCRELLSMQYRYEDYRRKMQELTEAKVLYLDDFLKNLDKSMLGRELAIAYEVIQARYMAQRRTIISSELFLTEIMSYDAATGGRISECARGFIVQMSRGEGRNYRVKV